MTYNSSEIHSNKTCFNCGEKNHIYKYYVYKDKGLKCFRWESFGHKAAECPGKNSEPDTEILNIDIELKLLKKVAIGGLKVNTLIDTGSQATLLRKSIYHKLNFGELQQLITTLSGFGTIQMDDFECNTDIWVVENKVMLFDGIIGFNVLKLAETIINEKGMRIRGKPQYTGGTSTLFILPIDLNSDEVEVNIEPVVSSILKNKVPESIPNCVSKKKN